MGPGVCSSVWYWHARGQLLRLPMITGMLCCRWCFWFGCEGPRVVWLCVCIRVGVSDCIRRALRHVYACTPAMRSSRSDRMTHHTHEPYLVYVCYYHFSSLRFARSQTLAILCLNHAVICLSHESMTRRLFNPMSDRLMNIYIYIYIYVYTYTWIHIIYVYVCV